MSVNYFLFLKKHFESIVSNLKETIDIYDDIISYMNEQHISHIKYYMDRKKEHILNLNQTLKYIDNCNYQLKIICDHNFVKDTIDISPDKSVNIEYCTICECNKDKDFCL